VAAGALREAEGWFVLHFKAPGRCLRKDFLAAEWGEFVRYMEVADDQYAVRQVEVFDNGNVLRYDRSHWCDDFGQLLGLRFSRKPKWAGFFPGAELIEVAEFERVWRAARRSPLWKGQVAASRAAKWGMVPHWLREAQDT
jgi:hypothetical protein